jgi:hypothetical protein
MLPTFTRVPLAPSKGDLTKGLARDSIGSVVALYGLEVGALLDGRRQSITRPISGDDT